MDETGSGAGADSAMALASSPKWDIGWVMKGFNGPLRRARLAKGLTQKQLAAFVGVPVQTLGRIELLLQRPGPVARFQIADFLGLDEQQVWPDWLEPRDQSLRAVAYQDVDAKTYSMLDRRVRKEVVALAYRQDVAGDEDSRLVRQQIESVLKALTDREREIVRMRFGLNDQNATYTLEECARVFKVTRERVKQIEAKAINKMRERPNAERLERLAGSAIECSHCGRAIVLVRYCANCRRRGCSYCMVRITRGGKYVYVHTTGDKCPPSESGGSQGSGRLQWDEQLWAETEKRRAIAAGL